MSLFRYRKCTTKSGNDKFFSNNPVLPNINQAQGVSETCCVPAKGAAELTNDKFFSGKNRFGKALKADLCAEPTSFVEPKFKW